MISNKFCGGRKKAAEFLRNPCGWEWIEAKKNSIRYLNWKRISGSQSIGGCKFLDGSFLAGRRMGNRMIDRVWLGSRSIIA